MIQTSPSEFQLTLQSPAQKYLKEKIEKKENIERFISPAALQKTFKFCLLLGNNSGVFRKILLSRGNWEEIKENSTDEKAIFHQANFIWKSYNFPVRKFAILDDLHKACKFKQTINHFENNRWMCTKTGLVRALSAYYRHNESAACSKYSVFDSCATSFVLTVGLHDVEQQSFLQRFGEFAVGNYTKERIPKKHCLENIWLLKPADANQGRGIEIFKTQKEIISSLSAKTLHSYWVVQKYIEKPLLYYGRKFDIRVWGLVTKSADLFFYKRGYIRTCSNEYNMTNIDPNLHLTNNFVQKHNNNYGQHEPGNTLPLESLFSYIDEKYKDVNSEKIDLSKLLIQRMKDLIIDTFLAAKKTLLAPKKYNCFEFFGYDFLIDEDLRVWLIEVNTNPYIGIPNDFIKELVPKMAEDLIQIAIDPIYQPSNPPVENRSNDFELIYCENGSIFNNGMQKNFRSPFNISVYPLESLAQKPNKEKRVNQNVQQQQYLPNKTTYKSTTEGVEEEIPEKFRRSNSFKSAYSRSPIRDKRVNRSSDQKDERKRLRNDEKQMIVLEQDQEDDEGEENQDKYQRITQYGVGKENESKIKQDEKSIQQQQNQNFQWDPEYMFQTMKKLIDSSFQPELQPFYPLVQTTLSRMLNWELLSEHDLKTVVKTLRLVTQSRIVNILSENKFVDLLALILDSQNHPVAVQEVSIEGLCAIMKTISNKLRIVSKHIISILIKISLCSCDEGEIEKYHQKIRVLATNCLIYFGGIYNRRLYIPGETRDNDKIRKILIENGGLLALLQIRRKAIDEELRKLTANFLDTLDISDFEFQVNLLKKMKGPDNILQRRQSDNAFDQKKQPNESTPKANQNKDEGQFGLPQEVLDLKYFDIKGASAIAEEIYLNMKEFINKREKEERMRKDIEDQKAMMVEKERMVIIQERKAKLEEFTRKKEEEKNRKKIEERKNQEKKRVIFEEEEKKRQQKYEELQKKREEIRRIQKAEEERKKQQEEDEIKRHLDIIQMKKSADQSQQKKVTNEFQSKRYSSAKQMQSFYGLNTTSYNTYKHIKDRLKLDLNKEDQIIPEAQVTQTPQRFEMTYNQYILAKKKEMDQNLINFSNGDNKIIIGAKHKLMALDNPKLSSNPNEKNNIFFNSNKSGIFKKKVEYFKDHEMFQSQNQFPVNQIYFVYDSQSPFHQKQMHASFTSSCFNKSKRHIRLLSPLKTNPQQDQEQQCEKIKEDANCIKKQEIQQDIQ